MFNFFCPLNIGMLFSQCGSVKSDFPFFVSILVTTHVGIPSISVVKETDADGVAVSMSLNVLLSSLEVIMIAKTFIFTHIIFILTFIERYFSWLCKK